MPSSFIRLGATAFVLVLGFFVCLYSFAPVHAASFTVTNIDDSGPGSLRQALIDANLAPGLDTITFAVTGAIVLDSPLPEVQDDVTLQGPGADQLVISGSYLYRILDVRPSVAMTISDLALTEGKSPNGEAGGAIRSRGELYLLRVHIHDNLSVSDGGAVSAEQGTLHIESSLVQSNTASSNGGISIRNSTAAITGTVFAQNQGSAIAVYRSPVVYITATQIISTAGRGLDAELSNLYLFGVRVLANTGGGIAAYGGMLSVEGSEIAGNRGGEGAGIYMNWCTIILTDTLLTRNEAQRQGGAIYLSVLNRHLTLSGGTISTNTAPTGAGIYVGGGNVQVEGTRIFDNEGSHGPALYLNSMGDAVVADGCVVNNRVTSGDGLAVELGAFNSYYLSAPKNWWGAADGPSGAGPGIGDSIDSRVIFVNFKTVPPDGCPSLPVTHLYLPLLEK